MHRAKFVRPAVLALCLSTLAAGLSAQATQQQPFEPKVGQAGKDVVWVPTPQALVDKMLEMAKVTPSDYLIDLGSGDGRTVITAARRGTRALGIEYNPDMVALSKRNAQEAGVASMATFMEADLFKTDFSKATVITMFLLPDINLKLRPQLLDLKPGTRIVSNSFTMGEWEEDEEGTVENGCTSWCTARLWIIPAKVAGQWRVGTDTLTLAQEFQMLSGTLGATPIANARMNGDEITFTAGPRTFTGKVAGTSMQGTVTGGAGGTWTATRQ